MQSEANSNVYHQILVHEMNWKRPLRFLFFVGGGGGGWGCGIKVLFIIIPDLTSQSTLHACLQRVNACVDQFVTSNQ